MRAGDCSGFNLCTFGTRRSGNWTAGVDNAGNGEAVLRAETEGCRRIAAIGAAYISASTARPIPAHQYRIPLNLSAVRP